MNIEPCDIILVSNDSFLSRIMGFFQSDPVKWGHSVIVGENDTVYSYSFTTMHVLDLHKYLKKKGSYEIFRYKHMTPEKQAFMLRAMKKFEGRLYGWNRLYLFTLNSIFGTKKFTDACDNKLDQVCSTFVSWIYYVAFRLKFNNCEWKSVDPDDIDDHCSNHKDWIVVAEV
jgi:hypothetical protein